MNEKELARELIGNVNNYAEVNGELSISAFGPLSDRIARALTTCRKQAWDEVLLIANEHLDQPGFGYLLRDKLRQAAANSVKDSEGEGVEVDGRMDTL